MNLQQLRILRETIRYNFNITEAANAIYLSQSGVSKQIRELEEELGSPLFLRRGKRLLGLSDLGAEVAQMAEKVLFEADNIRQAALRYGGKDQGALQIATTHTQARYILPEIILKFREAFPEVRLDIKQANPKDIPALILSGEADIGIASDVLENSEDILSFPFYEWRHIVICPAGHPLDGRNEVPVHELLNYPIITHEPGLSGRSRIDDAFAAIGAVPNIVMTALDADVIKAYVALGLGIGLVAPMAFDQNREPALRAVNIDKIFKPSTTSTAIRRGRLQRGFVYRFIEFCTPHLSESGIRNTEFDGPEPNEPRTFADAGEGAFEK
jgi:LysR family cys regulon transcriptional activator